MCSHHAMKLAIVNDQNKSGYNVEIHQQMTNFSSRKTFGYRENSSPIWLDMNIYNCYLIQQSEVH